MICTHTQTQTQTDIDTDTDTDTDTHKKKKIVWHTVAHRYIQAKTGDWPLACFTSG
jgi:carbohydrate-binding DOMON domain-containing protein